MQVEVSRLGSDVNLQCLSSCPPGHTSYVWFKNGQEVKEDTSLYADFSYGSADSYSCALKGYEDFPSPSVYAPKLPSVSVSPSAEIEEGSSVTLTCSSDANPSANYTWYKEDEDSPKASGQIFTITDFRAEHRSWKLPAAATIFVVLLAVISLSVFLWIRRKRASRDSSEPEERADNREECVPDQPEDLQYASVHFSNNRVDPLYSNMRAARPLGHTEQQEVPEDAAVKFSSAAPRVDLSKNECVISRGENQRVAQGQDDWGVTYSSTEICAVKGSTVEINCCYTYPSTWKDAVNTVGKTFWFTENKDGELVDLKTVSEYAGRVEDRCKNNTCTLRIRNLRESDSAEYRFRITTSEDKYLGEPGVTLFVTDLQVHVSRSRPNTRLQCLSSCRPPVNTSYIWFKNGQKIKEDTSPYAEISYDSADGYSCAVKGYEDVPSPSVLVHVLGSWGVTYTSKICAVKGSTVEISCSYTYPSIWKGGFITIQKIIWFTKNKDGEPVDLRTDSEYTGRVEDLCENNICTLRIKNLRESDSAEFMFRFTTSNDKYVGYPGTTLSVTDMQVEVSRSGSDVKLQCLSSCPPGHTSYIWFKNGQEVKEDTSLYADFSYDTADSYTCALTGYDDFPSPSVYGPNLPSVSVSPSAEIEEGSSVTLTCSSDANPAANYTWYKEDEDSPKASGQIFTITDFRAEHSGRYSCGAQNKLGRSNSTFHLRVVAGSSTMIVNIIRTTPVVLILIPVFLVGLWMRKKKTISHPTTEAQEPEEIELDSDPVYENFRVTAAHGVKSSQMLT
ncbi:uncharacterized protein [Pseudochaenichthys georgianus]|uniref:uncharacterized protein n=1 Tax=Pseudochaenichthys georgianus TaxID=52239 RepID=UPI00146E6197|nr:uncharacterized protein LOC117453271 [Pseudochaenichthys georgianus]